MAFVLLVSTFVLGFTVGVAFVFAYGGYKLRQMAKANTELFEKQKKKAAEQGHATESIQDRLTKVQLITKQQLELASMVDMPSKNALHSRYKNDLHHEIRRMEDDKNVIFRSILRDGHDPLVTILNASQEQETIKLSEYMIRTGIDMQGEGAAAAEPTPPSTPKKVGKFIVYTGGNNNDDTTH